jgi:hypothetical protein
MARPKWGAIFGGIAAAAAILIGVPAVLRHNTGAKPDQIPAAFEQLRTCADSSSHGDAGVRGETFNHAVNGGVHVVSSDSLHTLLPGQPVAALTRTVIDSVSHDTVITIWTEPPLDLAILKHEFANALSWRHRHALIGSDTGKFLTSAFYRRCVSYCPRCAAGAY